MALAAGPKSSRTTPINLDDLPRSLGQARLDIMRRIFDVELYPWQRRVILDLSKQGRPRRAYVQVPRKNGKTMLAAAMVLSEIILRAGRHTYGISDSERNLQSVLVRELRSLIAASPQARHALHVSQSGIENPANGSFFEVRPALFSATQGINPHLVIADEVHLAKEPIWVGMQLAGAARPDALLLGITTPGYDLTSLAHCLYQTADPTLYRRVYEAPSGADSEDRRIWRLANPCYGLPGFKEAIELDRVSLPEHEFRRFRLGQWTATEEAWLPYGAWDACRAPVQFSTGSKLRVWLGFDGSFSGDSTALVGASEDKHVFVLGCWENPGKSGWRVPRDEVEEVLAKAMQDYDVVELLCDPPYWGREISEWAQRWPNKVVEFPTFTRARMAPACTTFYSAVLERTLTHDGDERLGRHISNAVVKPSPQGDYITKADKDSPAKIDLAIAAIIAFSRASISQRRRAPLVLL